MKKLELFAHCSLFTKYYLLTDWLCCCNYPAIGEVRCVVEIISIGEAASGSSVLRLVLKKNKNTMAEEEMFC